MLIAHCLCGVAGPNARDIIYPGLFVPGNAGKYIQVCVCVCVCVCVHAKRDIIYPGLFVPGNAGK